MQYLIHAVTAVEVFKQIGKEKIFSEKYTGASRNG